MVLATVQRAARAASKPLHLGISMSNKYTYAKVLRAPEGSVVAQASTAESQLATGLETTSGVEGAAAVGKALGRRLLETSGSTTWSDIHVVRPEGKRFHGKFAKLVMAFKTEIAEHGGM